MEKYFFLICSLFFIFLSLFIYIKEEITLFRLNGLKNFYPGQFTLWDKEAEAEERLIANLIASFVLFFACL